MRNILFTAAVEEELMCAKIAYQEVFGGYHGMDDSQIQVSFMTTGIGVVSTTYSLMKRLSTQETPFDLMVNVGIAGTFTDRYPIGSVLRVTQEQFADLGVESSRAGFQTLFQYEMLDRNTLPFRNGILYSPYLHLEIEEQIKNLPMVSGVTVQTISGIAEKNDLVKQRFHPDIESMEGAAFFYVALMEKIPFLEIRSISNTVGERDKSRWDVPLAMNRLTETCKQIMKAL